MKTSAALLLLAFIPLTACQQKVSVNTCTQLPTDGWWEDKNFTQTQKTEFCITTWAYRLAPAKDTAETVADSVMYACRSMIAIDSEQVVAKNADLIKGDSAFAQQLKDQNVADLRKGAVFRVVQARAGKCPARASGIGEG